MCDVSGERKHGLFERLKKEKKFSLGKSLDSDVQVRQNQAGQRKRAPPKNCAVLLRTVDNGIL